MPSGDGCNLFCKVKNLFSPYGSSGTKINKATFSYNSTNNQTFTQLLENLNSFNSTLMNLDNKISGFAFYHGKLYYRPYHRGRLSKTGGATKVLYKTSFESCFEQ